MEDVAESKHANPNWLKLKKTTFIYIIMLSGRGLEDTFGKVAQMELKLQCVKFMNRVHQ